MDELDILFQRININPTEDDIENLITKVEKLKINNGQIKTNDKTMKSLISQMGELNLISDDKKKNFIKRKLRSYQKKRFRTGYNPVQPTKQEIDDIFDIMFRIKEGKEDKDIEMGGGAKRTVMSGLRHIKKKSVKKGGKNCGNKKNKKTKKN